MFYYIFGGLGQSSEMFGKWSKTFKQRFRENLRTFFNNTLKSSAKGGKIFRNLVWALHCGFQQPSRILGWILLITLFGAYQRKIWRVLSFSASLSTVQIFQYSPHTGFVQFQLHLPISYSCPQGVNEPTGQYLLRMLHSDWFSFMKSP